MASEMRHRLVDHARRRLAGKRGGGVRHEPADGDTYAAPQADRDATAALDRLDRAIETLAQAHPRAAQVVQLRFIGGLTTEEIAANLALSPGTIKREWTFAKAWLAASMASE